MDMLILCEKFCDYCLSIRGQSKATIKRYKYVIGCFSRYTGITELDQVTDEKVRWLFYYGRTERKWSVNTFRVYHVSLLVFFRWCMKQGYMEKNPITEIEVPKLEKKLPTKLSKQNAFRLLEIVNNYPKLGVKAPAAVWWLILTAMPCGQKCGSPVNEMSDSEWSCECRRLARPDKRGSARSHSAGFLRGMEYARVCDSKNP